MPDYTSWAGLLTPAPTQFGPDMKQIITLQNLAQQMQARQMVMQQEQQGQNALKQVYANKDNIDQSGYPTPNAMRELVMNAPSTGLSLMGDINKARESDLRTKLIGEKVSDEHRNWSIDMIAVPAVARRDEVLKQTGNLQLAQSEGQKTYNEGLEAVKADGRLGAKASELSPTFDYDRAKANILGRKGLEKAAEMDAKANEPITPYQQQELTLAKDRERREIATSERGAVGTPKNIKITNADGSVETTMGYFDKDRKDWHRVGGEPIDGKVSEIPASGVSEISDEDAKYLGQMYNLTGKFPSMYRDTASRAKILHEAAQAARESGRSPGDIIAAQAGVRADTMSLGQLTKVGDSATAYLKTALDNIKIVEEKMPKGVGTNWTWLNYWVQNGRVAFGDPNVPAYATALGTVANEYAKVMSGSTGAQGSTVDARREAASYLNQFQNTDQVYAALDVMKKDMDNKRNEYQDQRKVIEGRIAHGGEAAPPAGDAGKSAPSPGAQGGGPPPSTRKPSAKTSADPGSTTALRPGHEQEDFDALPHDTYFLRPDGKIGYKS